MDGIIVIDKPKDYTSRDIVNIASKVYKTKKVGHTGTLDPLATGVLILALGRATKLVDYLTAKDKEYEATIILGIETDTLDITGNELSNCSVNIRTEQIDQVLKSYEKTYVQEVPKYSAVKVNGRKLYEYARNNEEVVLPKKEVTIFKLERISDVIYEDDKTIFKVRTIVSKGTYIRSLIRDIASGLNTVGVMSELRRIRQGNVGIDSCDSVNCLKAGKCHIMPLNNVLKDIYTVIVDKELEFKIINGQVIPNIYNKSQVLFKNIKDEVLAIYKTHPNKTNLLKPYIMFSNQKNNL